MITPVKKKVRRKVAAKKSTPAAEKTAKAKKVAAKELTQAEIIAEALKKVQIANEIAMKGLRDEIKNIKLSSPTPPTDWIFDIVRDDDTGLILQIKASAPQPKRTLN